MNLSLFWVALIALSCGCAQAATITKCQDKEGNWHYGDFASSACAKDAPITEMDQQGMTVKKTGAPPTEQELKAKKAKQEKERREAAERAKQVADDQRLLRTYDNAQSIINARNERVSAMNRDLASQRAFRQDLVKEKGRLEKHNGSQDRISGIEQQIHEYDQAIETLKTEKQAAIEAYDKQLKRYRELTQ